MKSMLYVTLAAHVSGAWVSGAIADTFVEDFESYPDGLLPTPWYPVYEQVANDGTGYGDPATKAGQGSVNLRRTWNRGHAFRRLGGVPTTFSFMAKYESENVSTATVGLTESTAAAPNAAWFSGATGSDCIYAEFTSWGAAPWVAIRLTARYWDDTLNEGEGGWVSSSIEENGMGGWNWYFIEVTLTVANDDTRCPIEDLNPNPHPVAELGMYHAETGGPPYVLWTHVHVPPDFDPQYLAVSTRQKGYLDDISVTAGPNTMGSIDLTANLLDYSGDLSLMRMAIEVRDSGDNIEQAFEVTPTSTTVNQMVSGLPAGTYSVRVQAPKWLSKAVSGIVVTPGNTTPVALDLLNGDYDGDNGVTTTDVSVGLASKDEVGD